MHEQLKSHIRAVIGALNRMEPDAVDDLIFDLEAEMSDNAMEEDPSDADATDLPAAQAILDGLRFGYRAAVTVEAGGGAMLRVIEPRGARITHEWALARLAEPQIKAALAAVMEARE